VVVVHTVMNCDDFQSVRRGNLESWAQRAHTHLCTQSIIESRNLLLSSCLVIKHKAADYEATSHPCIHHTPQTPQQGVSVGAQLTSATCACVYQ